MTDAKGEALLAAVTDAKEEEPIAPAADGMDEGHLAAVADVMEKALELTAAHPPTPLEVRRMIHEIRASAHRAREELQGRVNELVRAIQAQDTWRFYPLVVSVDVALKAALRWGEHLQAVCERYAPLVGDGPVVEDETGRLVEDVDTVMDRMDRKRTEKALRERERRRRAAAGPEGG